MTEIPLGFSFAEADDGFILRRKSDDGTVTEIKMSEAELAGLKAVPGSAVQAILVHPVARALLQSDAVQENVLLTVEGSSGRQMTLSFPLTLAVELLRRIPGLVAKMRAANPTKQ